LSDENLSESPNIDDKLKDIESSPEQNIQHHQVTAEAENLIKYLENQWNQKKMDNSSSLFDHSRASM